MNVNNADIVDDCRFENQINQCLSIHGVAKNAKLGAIVLTCQNIPIYVEGVQSWENDVLNQPVAVTGVLRLQKLTPVSVVSLNGGHSAGVEGDIYILENPSFLTD
ncbi:MAG TPA: hypothetical protein VK203_14685 [Nostocaceae cyanobacterium]|nr:hypothetical protein [Nostocaceae cyanobacterium]